MDKFDETTITPSQLCLSVVDAEQRWWVHVLCQRWPVKWWKGYDKNLSVPASWFRISLVEGNGYFKDDKQAARFYLEIHREGYDVFIDRVKHVLDIFTIKFPGITRIFLFPSHGKYPPDGLNVASMNVYSGGKQAVMRDTVWCSEHPKVWAWYWC